MSKRGHVKKELERSSSKDLSDTDERDYSRMKRQQSTKGRPQMKSIMNGPAREEPPRKLGPGQLRGEVYSYSRNMLLRGGQASTQMGMRPSFTGNRQESDFSKKDYSRPMTSRNYPQRSFGMNEDLKPQRYQAEPERRMMSGERAGYLKTSSPPRIQGPGFRGGMMRGSMMMRGGMMRGSKMRGGMFRGGMNGMRPMMNDFNHEKPANMMPSSMGLSNGRPRPSQMGGLPMNRDRMETGDYKGAESVRPAHLRI